MLRLPGEVAIVECDWYYRDQAHLSVEDRARVNYDHPDAQEIDLLLRDVQALLAGNEVDAPAYDFTQHTRVSRTVHVKPRPVLVVEGIHALHHAALRALMQVKVFVDCPPNLRLSRRIQRDVAERGREIDDVLRQYQETVEPMHSQFVEQSRVHADLVLRGTQDPEEMAVAVCALIRKHRAETA